MWSPVEKCWVPSCSNSRDQGYQKNFFPLPSVLKYKEIWLALAGRMSTGSREEIYFCQDHFDAASLETYMEKFVCLKATAIPYFNMPERICRTCMSTIVERDVFCVLSANIPNAVPSDIKSDLLTFRPEPLLQLLNFCIPEVNLYPDPPPLVCFKCFHTIWLFYVFKLTCNAVEKTLRGNLSVAEYGKMVFCRSCPANSGTNFFNLKEDHPMGCLLKKMFLNDYPVDVVPLKVCLKCWNNLYKLERFYAQCLAVEQKLQRHVTLNQMRPSSTAQPPSKPSNSELCKKPTNQLKEFRKDVYPYQRPPDSSSSSLEGVKGQVGGSNFVTNTSIIRKQEIVDGTVERSSILHLAGGTFTSQSTSGNKVQPHMLSSTQQNVMQSTLKTEDKDGPLNSGELIRLTAPEEVALAELMLKHGKPLKLDLRPKAHFEVWVIIVREFHQSGYERCLETIQNAWTCMKKRAKIAFETIGPATFSNQLVIDYLYDYPDNKQFPVSTVSNTAKTKEDCDIICIDDDEDETTSIVAKEVATSTSEETSKTTTVDNKEKATKRRRKPNTTKKKEAPPIADHWNSGENLKLVRSIRKEYDKCLKNNQVTSGRSPWKTICRHLHKTEYQNYSFEKLYGVWSKLRVSAMVHEKNGKDVVDREVWKLLQMQNTYQKSVVDKSKNSNDKINKPPAVVATKDDQSTSGQGEGKKNESDDKDGTPTLSKRKVGRPLKLRENADVSQTPKQSKKGLYLTDDEKMQFFKLIKKEFHAVLKTGESVATPWPKIVARVYNNGFKVGPLSALCTVWYRMRYNATLHENTGKRSILDDKILRILKLHEKVKNTRVALQKPVKPADKVARTVAKTTKKAKTRKAAETARVTIVATENAAEEENEDSGRETYDPDLRHREKMDLIAAIATYGKEVFRHRVKRPLWTKVLANMKAKGYKYNINKISRDWHRMLHGAKLAWADPKSKLTPYDKAIIDFMTEVIQKNDKDTGGDTGKGNEGEDPGDEDDRFDEISERMSDPTNSPTNPASEEENDTELKYEYVSLEDIENNYGVDMDDEKSSGAIKNEPVEEDESNDSERTVAIKAEQPLPFKIESYTSEQIVEILDSDED